MRGERAVTAALIASVLASIGLLVVYVFVGGNAQAEGLLLGLALGGMGVAIVIWAVALIDAPVETEARHPMPSPGETRRSARDALDADRIGRRTFLVRLLAGAAGFLGAALLLPAFSLGPAPGNALFQTPWRRGVRVVDETGKPIRPGDVAVDTVRTVFPAGHVGSADGQTLLIRVPPELLTLPDGRGGWAPSGCVAYSKICTHAGCPVGLYRARDHSLLCPCHQSTFDVLRGAVPTFGPAARPLPQLPMEVAPDGYLVATGDFPEPVGPSFWNVTHREGKAGSTPSALPSVRGGEPGPS
ncbi:MAG: ubiquinol-cytochrome C reductase [Chloroflexi bacterium]|nr:MAG: ubiquinol-cytochrome C reductase [Chloroflexota bacterium]